MSNKPHGDPMKSPIKFLFIVLSLLSLPGVSKAQGFFSNPNGVLNAAQEAYLAGDFKTMVTNLKRALEDNPNDALVKENALDLLQKSYEVPGATEFPVDWRLPDEVKYLRVTSKRMVKDDVGYRLTVFGETVHPKMISQIQLIQYPDRVILDKQAGIGEWDDQIGLDPTIYQFHFETKKTRIPVTSGLYLLNLGFADGTQTKGWFILSDDINSTMSPSVGTPSVDQVFTSANPTFNWQNFVSPQYKPFERRAMWIGVMRSEAPNYNWDEVWGHYERGSISEEVTIGKTESEKGSVSKLENGHYIFFLDYHEIRKFGDLQISRDSITAKSFRIVQ
jgi:hypothetical protein